MYVRSGAAENTLIALLYAVDKNPTDTFTYELQSDFGGQFKIFGNELRTGPTPTDFTVAASYVLNIRATDNTGRVSPWISFGVTVGELATVEIPSTDITDILLSSATIPEHSMNGTIVGTLTTAGGTQPVSFVLLTSDGGRFRIEEDALVATGVDFTFEEGNRTVRIRAISANSSVYDKDFTITVTDVVEQPVTDVGRTSTVQLKQVGVAPLPAGVTLEEGPTTIEGISGTFRWLHLNSPGIDLIDWDLRGYNVRVHAPNCRVMQCLLNGGSLPRWGSYANRDFPTLFEVDEDCGGWEFSNNTVDGEKANPSASLAVYGGKRSPGTCKNNIITNMGSDGVFLAGGGLIENNDIFNNGYNWGCHLDGIWQAGVTSQLVIQDNYVDGRFPADRGTDPALSWQAGGENSAFWSKEELGHTIDADIHIRRNILKGGAMNIFIYPMGSGGGFIGSGSIYIYENEFGDDSTFPPSATNGGWISDTDFGQPALPAVVHAQNNTRIDGSVLGDRNPVAEIPLPIMDGGTPVPPIPGSVDDYVPSAFMSANGMSVPFPAAGKDPQVPTGITIAEADLSSLSTALNGVYLANNDWHIGLPGVYERLKNDGRRVVLDFTNTDPKNVIFRNCKFTNDVYTKVGYFGADGARAGILRSDVTYEYCSFIFKSEAAGGGVGECIQNVKGLVHAFRCKFDGIVGDPFNIGGGDIYECSFENCGNGDGVHLDIINWADVSIGPLRVKRCYFDCSLGTFPSVGGGFNALIKLSPNGGSGPTHDLVFEENIAWFSAQPDGAGSSSDNRNNAWYWFQNVAGTGQFRIKDNYLGMLREDFQTIFIAIPGSNFALQDNYKLAAGNAPWTGSQSDTTSTLPKPGGLTVTLDQNASSSTVTFNLPADTTFVEYEYRKKGDAQWLPRGVPLQIASGTTLALGDIYEFHFRPVFSTSGRRTTGDWVQPNVSSIPTAPSFNVLPTITGVSNPPRVGETATVQYTANGNPVPTASFLWERADGTDIGTSASHLVDSGDLAQGFMATVTLTNGNAPDAVESTPMTAAVVEAPVGSLGIGALGALASDQHHDGVGWDRTITVAIPAHSAGDLLCIPIISGSMEEGTDAFTPPSGWAVGAKVHAWGPGIAVITKPGDGVETSVDVAMLPSQVDGLSNVMLAGRCFVIEAVATGSAQGPVTADIWAPGDGVLAHAGIGALDASVAVAVLGWDGAATWDGVAPSGWTTLFNSKAVNDTDTGRSLGLAVLYKDQTLAATVDPGALTISAPPTSWNGFIGFYAK